MNTFFTIGLGKERSAFEAAELSKKVAESLLQLSDSEDAKADAMILRESCEQSEYGKIFLSELEEHLEAQFPWKVGLVKDVLVRFAKSEQSRIQYMADLTYFSFGHFVSSDSGAGSLRDAAMVFCAAWLSGISREDAKMVFGAPLVGNPETE